jgi:senataxin
VQRRATENRGWVECSIYVIKKVHLLNTQYRMDPKILAFPNREFYEQRIISGDNVLNRAIYVKQPFLFIDTSGRSTEELEGFSYTNVYEATVLKSLLDRDEDINRLVKESQFPVRIMIITPYKAQVKVIKEHLAFIKKKGTTLDVSTIDSYQGEIVTRSALAGDKQGCRSAIS